MVHRFTALDSWRGIAALVVAFGHLKTTGVLSSVALATTSYRFVDFFFVLSGFVIAHSSGEKLSAGWREATRFIVRRIARLWPLHLFVLGLFLAHQLVLLVANQLNVVDDPVAFTEGFDLAWLPANLAIVQAWGTTPYNSWNAPAWSISTEMFAYFCFALACLVGRRSGWMILAVAGAGCMAYALAVPETMNATVVLALVRGIGGFGLGVLTHRIWVLWHNIRVPFATGLEVAAIGATFLAITRVPMEMGALVVPLFALVVLLFAYEQGKLSHLLCHRTFTYLGERSYSIYLVHAFITLCLYSAAGVFGILGKHDGNTAIELPAPGADLLILSFLAATIAAAHYTYRFIEEPGRSFGKAMLARHFATLPGRQ
ncbi:acyltransferase family protein [Pelagerythrobacter sp.]|uniref:acyltransferase family protein n=1 Tax=Pelagerythrobacter sp. TaxID=2800702 RepID=UPI0035B4796C